MALMITDEAFYFFAIIIGFLAAFLGSFLVVVFGYAVSEKAQGRPFWAAVEHIFNDL